MTDPAFGVLKLLVVLWALCAAYKPRHGLDHPTRVRIYQHLLLLPGDHFRSIVRALRLSVGTARHHLDVLVDSGLLRTKKQSGRVRYYPEGLDDQPQLNSLFEKHWKYRDLRERILFTVRRMEEARPAEVARMIGISRQLAGYHLIRLDELGLVKRESGWYRAPPR